MTVVLLIVIVAIILVSDDRLDKTERRLAKIEEKLDDILRGQTLQNITSSDIIDGADYQRV